MNKRSITCTLRLTSLFAVMVVALTGCNNANKTQKEAANKQWNAARGAVLVSLGSGQFAAGNLDQARKTVSDAIALDPGNPRILVLSARIDIEQGRLEAAERTLTAAGTLDPTDAEVDYLRGVIHQRWQRPEQARDAYAAAVAKKPQDLAYLLAQAEMCVASGQPETALKLLTDRVIYFEHSAAIRDAIAQLFERQGMLDEAIEYYRQASVLAETDADIRTRLTMSLYRNGQHRDALAHAQRVLRMDGQTQRTDLMIVSGECLLMTNQAFEARQQFEAAARIAPSSTRAWIGASKASLRLGDMRRAELSAARAVAVGADSAPARQMLGVVRLRQRRYAEAMTALKQASQIDPSDPLTITLIGLAYEESGRRDAAIQWYGRALNLDPGEPLAGALLGRDQHQ